MNFLDELKNGALKKVMHSNENKEDTGGLNSLLNMAVGLAAKNGLTGFIDKLKTGGLKDHVMSWISTAKNKFVSAEELARALGPKIIDDLVKKTGMQKTVLLDSLSSMMPEIINKLTPNGEINENEIKEKIKDIDFK